VDARFDESSISGISAAGPSVTVPRGAALSAVVFPRHLWNAQVGRPWMSESKPEALHKFEVLCEITRAQHFAWREAVAQACPSVDPTAVVLKMWRVTGEQTARAYLERIDATKPLAPQVAKSIVWSSRCMGEDAVFEGGVDGDEGFVRHRACPWKKWHERNGLLAEDRPGCDEWFRAMCQTIGKATGKTVRFETLESLPEGGTSCLRRVWVSP